MAIVSPLRRAADAPKAIWSLAGMPPSTTPAGPGGQHRQLHRPAGARHLEGHVHPLADGPAEVARVPDGRRVKGGGRAEAGGGGPPVRQRVERDDRQARPPAAPG